MSKTLSLSTDLRHLYISAEANDFGCVLLSPVPILAVLETLVFVTDISLQLEKLELLGACVSSLSWIQVTLNCGYSEAFLGLKKVIESSRSLSHVDWHRE